MITIPECWDTYLPSRHYQNKIKDYNNEYQSINETVLRLKAQFTEGRKAIERVIFSNSSITPCTHA